MFIANREILYTYFFSVVLNPSQMFRVLKKMVSGAMMQEILESSCRQEGITDVELVAYN